MASAASKTQNKAKRMVRKTAKKNPVAVVLCVLFLIIGLAAGYFAGKTLTKNDCFELLGDKKIVYTVGDGGGSVTLDEPGWNHTALASDAHGKVTVTTDLPKTDGGYTIDTSEEGVYNIIYKSSHFLFSKYQLVRTVVVEAAEEGGEE